jgi:putative hemolysin
MNGFIDSQPYERIFRSLLVIASVLKYITNSFESYRVVNPAIVYCESNGGRVALSMRFRMFAQKNLFSRFFAAIAY